MKTATEAGRAATDTGAHYVLISADCHAGAPATAYREYLDPKYRGAFDDDLAARRAARAGGHREGDGSSQVEDKAAAFRERLIAAGFDADTVAEFTSHEALQRGGHAGAYDPDQRLRELEADGVVADVIFPDSGVEDDDAPPFGAGLADGHRNASQGRRGAKYDAELVWAGARAYNRWLADFCAHDPDRHAGVALVPLHDIEAAVAEIRWANEHGLRGGFMLPGVRVGVDDELPGYNDRCYDPVWAACEELGMPVNGHAGSGVPDYGPQAEAPALYAMEVDFYAHRPLWFLVWGGVFERFPGLKFVLTEQTAHWIPEKLGHMDFLYEGPLFSQCREQLSMKPSEYWARNCYVGATFMSRHEAKLRHIIGVDKIMWGSDYPHMEGTWPFTGQSLRKTYSGLPDDEVRLILGENAARVYNFDLAKLAPIAARVGPTVAEVDEPLTEIPSGNVGLGFR